jgi:hypothetical protein
MGTKRDPKCFRVDGKVEGDQLGLYGKKLVARLKKKEGKEEEKINDNPSKRKSILFEFP